MLKNHFDKENPHHAYLIEGDREQILPEVLSFVSELGVNVVGNPDFYHVTTDTFKIEDARNLKSLGGEMSFSAEGKRIFIISTNSFLLEAQNAMLKIFEEPIENTHFFLIVPSADTLLKTLVSRFYLIKENSSKESSYAGAMDLETEKFISMPLRARIDYIKELLIDVEEEDLSSDSTRAKALKFLNSLEALVHKKITTGKYGANEVSFFEQIFKVRDFLRMPGSSPKSLLESVALLVPNF